MTLLESGVIDVPRAMILTEGVAHLDEETAARVVAEIASEVSKLTTGQLSRRLQKLCITADPEQAENRFEQALGERRLVQELSCDGTAHLLGFDLPPDQVARAYALIDATARTLKNQGDERTIDQLRVDTYVDLLTGRDLPATPAARKGVVNLNISDLTLTGGDDPGEIPGLGFIVADVARQIAEGADDAEWRWQVNNHQTGVTTNIGTTRYRPGAAQTRRVQTRYHTCVAPGCRVPAVHCDIDHTLAHTKGGPTTDCNLAPLCRHHHRLKHHTPWQLKRHPNGSYQWTSPLGHTYHTNGQSP